MLSRDKTISLDSPAPIAFTESLKQDNLILDVTPKSGVTPATLHVSASGFHFMRLSLAAGTTTF